MNDYDLKPADYVEPRCLLCGEPYGAAPQIKPIPQRRIIEKLDDYMSRRDYPAAERHLLYWLEEAKLGGDRRGELMVRNELVGHYRKAGDRDKALSHGEAALALLRELDFDGTVSAGTTYTNVATACNAFGENNRALTLFEKAKEVYEATPRTEPSLLGGLYNNMALTYVSLGRYEEAFALYEKALNIMGGVADGALEQAITYLNMADATAAQKGMEEAEAEIDTLVDRAWELLNDPSLPRNGYYAFVCEKCAPSFSYYGYFSAANELTWRAENIYAENIYDRP
ncbi:MAG: tetratricopeptide repeat protein [Oscillospiraceae bacterium]|nr:tetratricopeptide repeat protein [Oscillospiraceae bacterium]